MKTKKTKIRISVITVSETLIVIVFIAIRVFEKNEQNTNMSIGYETKFS